VIIIASFLPSLIPYFLKCNEYLYPAYPIIFQPFGQYPIKRLNGYTHNKVLGINVVPGDLDDHKLGRYFLMTVLMVLKLQR
jgi:hypothetical protein